MRLECGVCVVRPWRSDDLDSLVCHANNRNVSIRLRDTFPYPYTRSDGEAWLKIALSSSPAVHFAIEVEGAAVGGIGYVPGNDVERCQAELGYWLGESFWGRGIATAAVQAVSDYAFASTELARLFAIPNCDNMASRRVLVKAGYQLEGTLRQSAVKEGRVIDRALYSRVRSTPENDFF